MISPLRMKTSPGCALFLLLFGLYLLTMSGHTYTSDEETLIAVGENLLNKGTFALEPGFLMNLSRGEEGKHYSRYGPGQSLVVIPLLVLGKISAITAPPHAKGFILRLFILILPALITAATGWLLFNWAKEIGYNSKIALSVGLLYGLTSLAWPYSRTFFAEPLATFFLTFAAFALRKPNFRWWLIAGLAASCALAVKIQTLLALPFIAGYAFLVSWQGDLQNKLHFFARRAGFGLLGATIPLLLLLFYNTQLFGNALNVGYGNVTTNILQSDWREGLYGLTFSTGKGLFFFSPTIILGLIGLTQRFKQQWREALLALSLFLAHLAFYSRIWYWHGDGSWGPRYLVFVLPFLYLPSAALFANLAEKPRFWLSISLKSLITLSFLIQLLPIFTNFNTYIQQSGQYTRFFTPSASPLIGHWRIWIERVNEWSLRGSQPAKSLVLRDGFSYSEGNRQKGELLPRWTRAQAQMTFQIASKSMLEGKIVVADHRPWTSEHPLPRANFALLLNGKPLENVTKVDLTSQQIVWELRFQLSTAQLQQRNMLTLQSDTWNPTLITADNPRNEDLGLFVQTIDLRQDDQTFKILEALPISSVPSNRRALWLWYYDAPNHHLFDLWLWYLFVAGIPSLTIIFLLFLIGLPAILCFSIGLSNLKTTLQTQ